MSLSQLAWWPIPKRESEKLYLQSLPDTEREKKIKSKREEAQKIGSKELQEEEEEEREAKKKERAGGEEEE